MTFIGQSYADPFLKQITVRVSEIRLLGFLYLCELSALLIVLALYRLNTKPDLLSFLASGAGFFCLGGFGIFVVSTAFIIHQLRNSRSRQLVLTILMNLITVTILMGSGELFIRIFSVQTPTGIEFGNLLLHPRSWQNLATRYINTRATASGNTNSPGPTYHVYDGLLGWTVGPNRRSENGLYVSGIEGIRSPRESMVFADHSATYRIALVGDSFTFGDEVSYEESWGHQLERNLGPEFQVLNFGVSGYGTDQAYLRYKRDVRTWRPDIVIFGLISDDLLRNMTVYPLLMWPGTGVPGAKPRFVLKEKQLVALNIPPLTAEEIVSRGSIRDLPFVEHDRNFHSTEWERPHWRYFHLSYLFRFLISWYPPWDGPREHVSDAAMEALARELLHSFVQLATAAGSIPIVVFFPDHSELNDSSSHATRHVPLGLRVMRDAGIEHTNLTPCLSEVNTSDRFVNGKNLHYLPKENTAVAKCLHKVVLNHLSKRKQRTGVLKTHTDVRSSQNRGIN